MVKTILKYLKNTKDQWLIYEELDLKLVGYTDFSFQSNRDDSKSISEIIFILNRGVIYWKSSKTHTVTDSVCEVEYIIASDAAKEAMWLWKFLDKLRVVPILDSFVLVYYDSIGAIAQAKEPKSHHHTKHILCHNLLVWEIMEWDDVDLQKIGRKENLADPLTKALKIRVFDEHMWKMDNRYYFN